MREGRKKNKTKSSYRRDLRKQKGAETATAEVNACGEEGLDLFEDTGMKMKSFEQTLLEWGILPSTSSDVSQYETHVYKDSMKSKLE